MVSKIGIIIEREYKTRVMKKSFILMTFLTPLLFLLMSAMPAILMLFSGEDKQVIAVLDHTGLYREALPSTETYNFVVADKPMSYYRSQGTQAEDAQEGLPSGVLEIRQDLGEDPRALTLFSFSTLPSGTEAYINRCLSNFVSRQRLLSHNIPDIESIIAESQTEVEVSTYKLGADGAETVSSSTLAEGLGFLLSIASYLFISLYGNAVMVSVMEEKKSRIMEVMVSAVRPFDLMMGKIIGVGLVGLTQIVIWLILLTGLTQVGFFFLGDLASGQSAMLAGANAQDQAEFARILSTLATVNFFEIGLCFMLYFVGGFLLYASIYAALGSVTSSDEDAQFVAFPVVMLMLLSFYTGFACMQSPESTLAQVASYIPFTSPVVMMIRIPYGVEVWEEVLSLLVLYAGFTLMVYLGARIYRVGVLMYGKKPSFKEIWRWMLSGK